MSKKKINVGTLFSGIGAFEHSLNQLQTPHQILFACDNGERELPLTYDDLKALTKGLSDNELYAFCEDYINHIGVKREYRNVEIQLLYKMAREIDSHPLDAPVIVEFSKVGRKSLVKHKLTITQDQINQLTPNMSMKDREQFNVDLAKIYSVKLSDERVIWSNPDKLQRDAHGTVTTIGRTK